MLTYIHTWNKVKLVNDSLSSVRVYYQLKVRVELTINCLLRYDDGAPLKANPATGPDAEKHWVPHLSVVHQFYHLVQQDTH